MSRKVVEKNARPSTECVIYLSLKDTGRFSPHHIPIIMFIGIIHAMIWTGLNKLFPNCAHCCVGGCRSGLIDIWSQYASAVKIKILVSTFGFAKSSTKHYTLRLMGKEFLLWQKGKSATVHMKQTKLRTHFRNITSQTSKWLHSRHVVLLVNCENYETTNDLFGICCDTPAKNTTEVSDVALAVW